MVGRMMNLLSHGKEGKSREMRIVPVGHPPPEDGQLWYCDGLGYCICKDPFSWSSLSAWRSACLKDSSVYTRLGLSDPREVCDMTVKKHWIRRQWEFGFEFISLEKACDIFQRKS